MKDNYAFSQWLKENGLKTTKQRTAILLILQESDRPMDAELILSKMKGEADITKCNLSTVYRNMEKMVELGLVIETKLDMRTYYALRQEQHGHMLQCMKCKEITVVSGCPMEQFEKQLERNLGFRIVSHKIELYGICNSCSHL